MSNSTTSSPRELHSRAFHRTTCVVKSSRSHHERQRTPESHMRTAICADGDPQHAQSRKYCTSGSRANRFSLQCSVNALIRQRARCTNAPRISRSSLPARRRHRVKSMPEGRVATLKQVGSLQEFTCDEVATLGQVGSPRDCPPGRVATLGQVGGPRDCPPGRVATLGQVGSPRAAGLPLRKGFSKTRPHCSAHHPAKRRGKRVFTHARCRQKRASLV